MEIPKIYVRNSPNENWNAVSLDDAQKIVSSLYIDASGCTALTELKAEAAEYIDASGCTALTELKAEAFHRLMLAENAHELITDLRPWREEMANAEAIFEKANPQVGDWCAWIHHEIAFEKLQEPWQNRFQYVASEKPEYERAWRFRLIRPASDAQVLAAIRDLNKVSEVQG